MEPVWVQRLLGARYGLLCAIALIVVVIGPRDDGGDWNGVFVPASQWLLGLGPDGASPFEVYRARPVTQIGPIALLVAGPMAVLPLGVGRLVAFTLMMLALPALVWLTEDAARRLRPDEAARTARVAVVAGLACVPLWRDLAMWAMHLDDVLAMLFAAAAVNAVARGRASLAGLAIALAIGSKPWAVPFALLLLALPEARNRLRAVAVMTVGVAVIWVPFLVVPGTFTALAQLRIQVYQTSALSLFGVVINEPAPGWIRPAQLLIGVGLAAVFVHRGRWAAVPLVAVAVRISLDAGVWNYYFAGLVAGALIWDVIGSRYRFPWWTVACLVAEYDVRWLLNSAAASAWLSVAPLLVALLAAAVPSPVRRPAVSVPALPKGVVN